MVCLNLTLLISYNNWPAMQSKSNLDLMRSLAVFQMCRLRPIVDNADSILAWSKRIFGSTLVNAVVRQTFYKHFVAGACVSWCVGAGEELTPM